MHGALVDHLGGLAAGLHHHATTHGVEGVGDDAGDGGHDLGDGPVDVQRRLLGVGQHAAGCVVEAEVGGAVDDDTLDGYTEAAVQAGDAVRLGDLAQAVAEAIELAGSAGLADISSQAGTGEVQGVDEAQGGGSGQTTGGQVADEVAPELCVLVHAAQEDLRGKGEGKFG